MSEASAASVSLLMAIHCHQPVGNFGFVFEEAYRQAYEPFVAALERHPAIRVAIHYSGPLLDWFQAQQPDFIRRLRALVARGQVEMLAGGYYEPLLPLIPEVDRQGQIALMRRAITKLFGVEATGLWLTERVWEPELPGTLSAAGIAYTMLDTNHFLPSRALLPPSAQVQDEFWDVLGCYTTEHAGRAVQVFPMSKRLRYWIPFQEPDRTVEFLRRAARTEPAAVTYADDGEKFGLWPKTYAWVYEQGWLERFFTTLEREASWLRTETFGQYWQRAGSSGRVYLPSSSYEEMIDWSRGYFRNFLVKYPESQAMYQKILRVSRQLQARRAQQPNDPALEQATLALYRAQCNDSLWHGVFGGLYLANLRREVWRWLLTAERLLEPKPAWPSVVVEDADGDARPEVTLRQETVAVSIMPHEHGTVTEVAHYPTGVNLVDTLTRRPEPYHEKLKAKQLAAAGGGPAPTSIHDTVRVKEPGLESRLVYDDHRRVWFVDYGFSTMPSLQQVCQGTWGEHRLWSWGPWTLAKDAIRRGKDEAAVTLERPMGAGRLEKTVTLERKAPVVGCRLQLRDVPAPVVALEVNLGLQDDARRQPAWEEGCGQLTIRDPHVRVAVTLALEPAGTVATFPIETVSDSEEGLERTLQGIGVVCLWPTTGPGWAGSLRATVEAIA